MTETTEAHDPKVVNNIQAGRFEITIDGQIAFAEYRLLRSGVLFPHTEVPQALEGRGLGSRLVQAGLSYAREKGLAVMPVCPFFAAYMKRHPETHDLLHPDYRVALGV